MRKNYVITQCRGKNIILPSPYKKLKHILYFFCLYFVLRWFEIFWPGFSKNPKKKKKSTPPPKKEEKNNYKKPTGTTKNK